MSFAVSFKRGSKTPVGKHFVAKEFDCPCERCTSTHIDLEFVKLLDKLREKLGTPLEIHTGGGYRCDWYQKNLAERGFETAKGLSTHQAGRGVDISTGKHTGKELEEAAREVGIRAVGLGKTWIHVDGRDDKDRKWSYK